jgi:hypothetical protein
MQAKTSQAANALAPVAAIEMEQNNGDRRRAAASSGCCRGMPWAPLLARLLTLLCRRPWSARGRLATSLPKAWPTLSSGFCGEPSISACATSTPLITSACTYAPRARPSAQVRPAAAAPAHTLRVHCAGAQLRRLALCADWLL